MKTLGLKSVAVRGVCGLAALILSFFISFLVLMFCVGMFIGTTSGQNVAWPIIAGLSQGRVSIPFHAYFQLVLSVLHFLHTSYRVAH